MYSDDHSGHPGTELIDAYFLALDPAYDGFSGVFVELYRFTGHGSTRYEVRQSAAATANRLLVFQTCSEELARAVFEGSPEWESVTSASKWSIV